MPSTRAPLNRAARRFVLRTSVAGAWMETNDCSYYRSARCQCAWLPWKLVGAWQAAGGEPGRQPVGTWQRKRSSSWRHACVERRPAATRFAATQAQTTIAASRGASARKPATAPSPWPAAATRGACPARAPPASPVPAALGFWLWRPAAALCFWLWRLAAALRVRPGSCV